MKKIFYLFSVVFLLTACSSGRPLTRDNAENNPTYQVSYLFEHDGCKVYRFMDNGNYIYFTNCTGNVTAVDSDTTSIQTITNRY